MAANKSLTQICLELGSVASEAMSDVASQHSSGSGSGSGTTSAAPSVHEAMQEAVAMPLATEAALSFEDPVPQPLEGEALPRPITPIASPLQPSGVTQRRSSKAQAVDSKLANWPGSPRAWPEKPSTEFAKKTDAPASPVREPAAVEGNAALPDGENNKNKQLVTYFFIPALAFAATYFGGPLIAPSLFENKLTGQQDTKKTIMAATLAACGAVLTARCVL